MYYGLGDGGVIDSRGRTVVIHYSLAKMPVGLPLPAMLGGLVTS